MLSLYWPTNTSGCSSQSWFMWPGKREVWGCLLKLLFLKRAIWCVCAAEQSVAVPMTANLVNKNVTKLHLQFIFFSVNKVSNDRKDKYANYCLSLSLNMRIKKMHSMQKKWEERRLLTYWQPLLPCYFLETSDDPNNLISWCTFICIFILSVEMIKLSHA